MSDMSIDVYINRTCLRKQLSHEHKSWVHICQIARSTVFSHIAIGSLFDDSGFLVKVGPWKSDFGSIICLTVKWRVNIDQVYLTSHTGEIIGFVSYEKCLHREEIIPIDQTIVSSIRLVSSFEVMKESLIVAITTRDHEFIGL